MVDVRRSALDVGCSHFVGHGEQSETRDQGAMELDIRGGMGYQLMAVISDPVVDEVEKFRDWHISDVSVFIASLLAFDLEVAHESVEIGPDDGPGRD